jgi:cation transporter-like permease
MRKKLKFLGVILMSVPVLAVGASTFYTMFCIEPIGTVLLTCLVAGLVLYVLNDDFFTLPRKK